MLGWIFWVKKMSLAFLLSLRKYDATLQWIWLEKDKKAFSEYAHYPDLKGLAKTFFYLYYVKKVKTYNALFGQNCI